MSALAQIKALYAYDQWADGHVMDAASKLADDQDTRDLGASFGSVRGNLSHIVGARHCSWRGSTPRAATPGRRSTETSRRFAT